MPKDSFPTCTFNNDEFKYFVCADLPLFYAENKQLNLSEQEVLQVVQDLIAFADDLESTYMQNMDISNESIIEENLPNWRKQTEALIKNRGNRSDRKWQTINEYLYRERKYDDNFELMNHMYAYNMNEPFVKFVKNFSFVSFKKSHSFTPFNGHIHVFTYMARLIYLALFSVFYLKRHCINIF